MTDLEIDELLDSSRRSAFPASRLTQIESVVIGDLKPVRPLASSGTYIGVFTAIFLAASALGCYMAGQFGWRALSDVQRVAVFVPLAVAIAALIPSIVFQMRPASGNARFGAIVSAIAFAVLLVLLPIVFHPAQESAFLRRGLTCFRMGMLFAVPAGLVFAWLLRRGAGLSPALTGATAGTLAGLVGLAVLEIHCPNLNVYHIVVGHVSVTVVCLILGLVFSSVTFRRWRSNP